MFKSIDDEDITYIQNYIRQKLLRTLNLADENCRGSPKSQPLSEEEKRDLFGQYSSCPSEFEFQRGEIKLIKAMVSHVKKIADSTEGDSKRLHYFRLQNRNLSQLSSTMDRFFRSDHWANAINPEAKKPNNGERGPIQNKSRTHYVLNKLLVAADKNSSRKKEGFRYDDDMKIFSSYVRMLSGPLAYETVQKNLPGALPALSSTNRYVRKSNCRLQEGILRCHELYLFLTSRNLPLLVSLSEDATRIVGRVQYDATTNQLVGFVLPISSSNGLPIPFIYQGRDANEIAKHFSGANPIASFVNAVMAQPIPGGPPFCLLLFGSDNRYTSADVANRWKYIAQELEKLNIAVLTISSDSDPKYNSAMRKLSLLGYESNIFEGNEWFSCGENLNPPFYIQDMTHIGTKLRNFLLRTTNDPKKTAFRFQILRGHKTSSQNFGNFTKSPAFADCSRTKSG